jgi:Amt family ammonium transporter
MRARHLAVGAAVIGAGVLLLSGVAGAQDAPPNLEDVAKTASDTYTGVNLLWVVIGAILVIFMQAGFALVETGFTRAKNAAHTVAMNFAVFGLGFIGFLTTGFAFAFSGYSFPGFFGYDAPLADGGLVGSGNWVFLWGKSGYFLGGIPSSMIPAVLGFFLYMAAFMDTVATIPTGSMAERWRWKPFVCWALFCGAVYYPLFTAWTWGGGWLAKLGNSLSLGNGYVDFAGSGVVHAVGGTAALTGAIVLGARIGKYAKDGTPRAIPGHHIPMAMLGTFILLTGWFGFNAASTLAATDIQFAVVATNTAIAAVFGAVVSMLWISRRAGKPDPGMMANGMLAGLVAITAPCAFVSPWAAAIIGTVAGVLVIEAVFFIERRLKVDDPVGAVAVHGVNGIWGVIAVGLFANGSYGIGWNGARTGATTGVTGLFYGGSGAGQLVAQLIGVAVIVVVLGGVSYGFFKLCDKLFHGGIRVPPEVEIGGLDLPEMGVLGYPDFVMQSGGTSGIDEVEPARAKTPTRL